MVHMIPEQEIVFKKSENALRFMEMLADEKEYITMLSREENLYIVDVIWAPSADRNYVVLMQRDVFEEHFNEIISDEDEDENW